MRRRTFLKQSSLTALNLALLGVVTGSAKSPAPAPTLRVNGTRIDDRINQLATFGRDANGHGYRVAYTQGDREGRAWFIDLMKKAGLDTSIDAAGNIVGRRKGKNAALKPIIFGSHIDMVPDGGNYDGTVGSISALEVIEVLREADHTTNHPLEVIIFGNEEGGTIGSMALAGKLTPEGLKKVSQSGLTMAEGIRAIGGDPDRIASIVRKPGDIHAFVELHIEQGGILDRESIQIGVVEGIVGMMDWEITLEGFANHAGTTPMNLRKDALVAASRLTLAVNEVITSVPGRQVGTVGKMSALPGASNVIPGKVNMSLEIRDLSIDKVKSLFQEIEQRAKLIAADTQVTITFDHQFTILPAPADPALQQKVNAAAKGLGLSTRSMPSGAIHDSQHMALIAPMAMIFVPSVGGISHSPKEFSRAADIAKGANVLLQTVLDIDRT